MRHSFQHGVTLIELMITLTILGILTVAAMPSYSQWIQNSQIRTASDAILNGLQLARAEAVRRNAAVSFTLSSGTAWTINIVSDNSVVQSRSAGEGSRNVISTVTPGVATKVTFNGLGRVSDVATAITQINLDVPITILAAVDSRDPSERQAARCRVHSARRTTRPASASASRAARSWTAGVRAVVTS